MTLFRDFWCILTPKQRRGILTMQIVSVAMAFSTVGGIAAIAPFFAVLGQPELIDHNALLHWAYAHGGVSSKRGFGNVHHRRPCGQQLRGRTPVWVVEKTDLRYMQQRVCPIVKDS